MPIDPTPRPHPPLALLSAMREEMHTLAAALHDARVERLAGREFHVGRLAGRPVVVVYSGIGKVAAATTAALLLDRFDVGAVLFTGVAGGLAPGVQVGDVLVATELLQHDLDVSPLFPRFHVPMSGRARFDTDLAWRERLSAAAQAALPAMAARLAVHQAAGARAAQVHHGLLVSGDRFVATRAESDRLRELLPDALAVEMEGAAVAQVCADFNRPLAVLRTVSDRADDDAAVDFPRFVVDVASEMAQRVLQAALAEGA